MALRCHPDAWSTPSAVERSNRDCQQVQPSPPRRTARSSSALATGISFAFGTSTRRSRRRPSISVRCRWVRATRSPVAATTPQGLTVTGPATVSGYQGLTGPTSTQGLPDDNFIDHSVDQFEHHSQGAPPQVRGLPPPPEGQVDRRLGVRGPANHQLGRNSPPVRPYPLSITFTPDGPGPVAATLSIPTSAGSPDVLHLRVRDSSGTLAVSQAPRPLGTVNTGAGGKTLTVSVTNSSDRPETVTGIDLPRVLPTAVTGLPSVGTVLAPQQSVTTSVDFDPGVAGSYPSTLQSLDQPWLGDRPGQRQCRHGCRTPHCHQHLAKCRLRPDRRARCMSPSVSATAVPWPS